MALLAHVLEGRIAEGGGSAAQHSSSAHTISGTSIQLPGLIRTHERLSQMLAAGLDVVGEIPLSHWDAAKEISVAAAVGLSPAAQSRMRHGAFIDHADLFDAGFFGVSPSEAWQWTHSSACASSTATQRCTHQGGPKPV